LLAHEVATALRAGGKVVLTANGPVIAMPQDTREAEQGEESHRPKHDDLSTERRKTLEGFVEEWTQENRAQGPAAVMYAVSGQQRIFQNR
jgi:hypothetical protein